MERLDQLQKAFSSLQVACEKREQMEKQLRSRLEKEVETMKSQHQSTDSSQEELSCTGTSNISDVINIHSLQRLLNEKEAKILQLQTVAVKVIIIKLYRHYYFIFGFQNMHQFKINLQFKTSLYKVAVIAIVNQSTAIFKLAIAKKTLYFWHE